MMSGVGIYFSQYRPSHLRCLPLSFKKEGGRQIYLASGRVRHYEYGKQIFKNIK